MSSEQSDRESQVAKTLLSASSLGHAMFEVEFSGSTITLRGTVETEQARSIAEALVQEQMGVVEVINELKISEL